MPGKISNYAAVRQILLHTYQVPGSVLGPGKRRGGKINRNPCLFGGVVILAGVDM